MPEPTNFKFCHIATGVFGRNVTCVSSPIQTVSGGENWLLEEFDNIQSFNAGCKGMRAIKTDGTLWLWGEGTSGLLGTNATSSQSSPVQTISQGNNWKQVAGGGYRHTAAIKTDGTLWLWGDGSCGALGDNTTTNKSSPVQTSCGGNDWEQVTVSVDKESTAAIKTDGTLWLWGNNSDGQLGDGTTVFKSNPVQTSCSGTNWKQVSLTRQASSAIKTDGTLWVWGDGLCGQLGTGTVARQLNPVQTISQGTNWKQIATGRQHMVAVKTDGTLWLWGRNQDGQLGIVNSVHHSSPVQTVSTGTNWKQVGAGLYFTGAIKTDGTLWMWGQGGNGALGNNATTNQSSPVQTVSTGTDWKQVAFNFGQYVSGAIKADGTLWTWGQNSQGQVGDNTTTNRLSPVQTVSTGTDWTEDCAWCSFSAGDLHSAAIKTDGTLWLWGEGTCGALGNNSTLNQSSPVQTVSTGTNWKQVSLGVGSHSAAIKTDGTLWLWGDGGVGRLGNNSTINRSSPVQTVSTGTNWKQVSAGGGGHSAAIKTDGTLWLWGCGLEGRLGNNSSTSRSSPVQTVSTGTNWKQVSLGCAHSAAVKTDGTLWLWGFGSFGQLGTNTTTSRLSPVQTVSTGTNWKQVSLGGCHSAAIKTDGTLWLWGGSTVNRGVLGTNSTLDQSSPVQTVSTGNNWKQVSLGGLHSAAIKTDGTLWLWGCGTFGRLGNDSTINRSSPVQTVTNTSEWKQVSLGGEHSLALKDNNQLYGWGNNSQGQLGCDLDTTATLSCCTLYDFDDVFVRKDIFSEGGLWLWGLAYRGILGTNSTTDQSSPVQTITGGSNWKQVNLSRRGDAPSSAAIKTDGTLWLWGYGANGRLGNNSTTDRSSPVQTVSTGNNWKQVSLGFWHSTAIKTDGTLWLWGCADGGLLGTNSTLNRSSPVQTVSTGTNWKQVSAGDLHSAAIKTDGTLWLWGSGDGGRLGNNATTSRSSPVQTVSTETNWKQISLGGVHSAAIKTDGTLWLWGNGGLGRLGNNTTTNQSSPVQTLSTGTNWKQVSLGSNHSAAIKTDGTLWLWGSSCSGQLGNNSTLDRSSPVQTLSTGTNWKQVDLGLTFSTAIKTDGTLWLWGASVYGKLGNNATTDQSSPVQTVSTGTNWKQVSAGGAHSGAVREDCW